MRERARRKRRGNGSSTARYIFNRFCGGMNDRPPIPSTPSSSLLELTYALELSPGLTYPPPPPPTRATGIAGTEISRPPSQAPLALLAASALALGLAHASALTLVRALDSVLTPPMSVSRATAAEGADGGWGQPRGSRRCG